MKTVLLFAISVLLLTGCATKCKQYGRYNYYGWDKWGQKGIYSKPSAKVPCIEITPISEYDSALHLKKIYDGKKD